MQNKIYFRHMDLKNTRIMNNNRIFLFSAILFIGLTIFLNGCVNHKYVDTVSPDSTFEAFKRYYVEESFKIDPSKAIAAGRHDYDNVLSVPSLQLIENRNNAYQVLLDSLLKFDKVKLSDANRIDFNMMLDKFKGTKWYNQVYREYEWNPASFNVSEGFSSILNGQYAPLDIRLRNFAQRLINVTAYYEGGKSLLKSPTIEHTDLAILQNESAADEVFGKALKDSISASSLSSQEKANLLTLADSANNAMVGYAGWLKEKRKSMTVENSRSFRIGKELFDKKFEFDIVSEYSAEQMYEKAKKRKSEIHHEMAALSRQLWPKYFKNEKMPEDSLKMILKMIDKLSQVHVKPGEFMASIKMQIPELIDFINLKKLIYIDPSKPLVVRQTPAYMEGGGAGASISAPGPFDKDANTYYNVSPLTGYKPVAAESFLREYNKYVLQILNIHEAIPGHYTQLVYSNNSPSLIKSLYGNGAMIEGWAVYTERMMLENGYGNNEPEMWLCYYKWHLRSVCNTILDYSVHALNMSEEAALKLLIEGDFQQDAEAEGKWRRVKLTQVQLCSYFTGFTEIYELRERQKKALGDKFDLKKFHEKFLSYGSAPVKFIKELMMASLPAEK